MNRPKTLHRRAVLASGSSALVALATPWSVSAQGRYPDRPIRLVVPFAPGGATDVAGRLWAERIKPLIGTVVVENRASGGGTPGAAEVARAPADGYTFLFGNTSTQVVVPAIMPRPPYDPLKDLVGVYILCLASNAMVHHKAVRPRGLDAVNAHRK